MFFRRGPLGLAGNDHYGLFSKVYHQDQYDAKDVLLQDPGSLIEDPLTLWTSSFYKYMTPKKPSPSMHEVVSGLFVPAA